MYNVKGALFASVGFLGYFGGFEASCVISESELASGGAESIAPTVQAAS